MRLVSEVVQVWQCCHWCWLTIPFSVLDNTRKEHGEMTKEKEPCQNPDGIEREEACLEEEDPSEVAETR